MKNNLIMCGCLGILIACGGAIEKGDDNPADSTITFTEQSTSKGEIAETKVNVDRTNEASGISSEEAQESEIREIQDTNVPEAKLGAAEKELSAVAVKEEPAVAAISPQLEEQQVQANMVFISVVPDLMKFDKEVFTVIAGQEVIIELDNLDGMQHNLVISKPGTLKKVGAAADDLARDPQGAQKNYVPEIPEVLHATKLLEPGEVVTLTFTAPTEPGDYPFVCTFPGHWRMMNGIMKVTK